MYGDKKPTESSMMKKLGYLVYVTGHKSKSSIGIESVLEDDEQIV